MRSLRTLSLTVRITAIVLLAAIAGAALTALLMRWLPTWTAALAAGICAGCLAAAWSWRTLAPLHKLFHTLVGTVASYRDGDFSFSIAWDRYRELNELVASHNALGETLREQRLTLVQRELLLDTMVQNTPVAMVLLDPARRIVHGNLAARRLLGAGRKLEGRDFDTLLTQCDPNIQDAFARGGDGMFSMGQDDAEEIYHLSRRKFLLNGRQHELIMLRQLTAELRRQEVQIWKKVIRVISHELNNSLAPIASLAHSGQELLRRGQYQRLPNALATIEERARHLEGFLRDYACFAKLPAPRTEPVEWQRLLTVLREQVEFVADVQPPDGIAHLDQAQIAQALVNLLKNAHESGSRAQDVRLQIRRTPEAWRVEVLDRGSGMNQTVLGNALLPFYSTKRNGTGLGLALAREIAEAHGGRIALHNRDGGGLSVSLILPP